MWRRGIDHWIVTGLLVNAAWNPPRGHIWTALRLERAATTIARACEIEKRLSIVDQIARRCEDVLRRADVHIAILVEREVFSTESSIRTLRFVDHRELAAPIEVALVENVMGAPAGVKLMDYVETGKTIQLASSDGIVLSYLSIAGAGIVTIGIEQSEVQGGRVARSEVACDAGKMVLEGNKPAQFAGRIFAARLQASRPQSRSSFFTAVRRWWS
jgi:hypothetical protein